MTRIQSVLQTSGSGQGSVSVDLVNHWIGGLRAIPYGFTREWKTPSEVGTASAADCKGKAVALYEKMKANGASNVRLVIGKRTSMSRQTHAWLIWETAAGNFVLDPTINWMAFREEQAGKRSYIPYYAYSGTKKFRASSSTLVATN